MPGRHGQAPKGIAALEMRARRRARVAELHTKGISTNTIAQMLTDEFGDYVPARNVRHDLITLRKRWAKSANIDTAQSVGEELASIRYQLKELWEAWEKSKQRVEVLHVRRTVKSKPVDKTGKLVEGAIDTVEEKTVREGVGDTRIMEQITKLRDQRCKLLGLYQDVNLNVNNFINFDEMADAFAAPVPDEVEDRILMLEAQDVKVVSTTSLPQENVNVAQSQPAE